LALGRRVRKIFLTLIGVLIHANPPTQLSLNRRTNGDTLRWGEALARAGGTLGLLRFFARLLLPRARVRDV